MLITVLRVKFSHPNPMFQPQISKIMQELLGSDQDLTQIIGNLIVRVVTSIPHTRRTLRRCTSKRTNDCRCVCNMYIISIKILLYNIWNGTLARRVAEIGVEPKSSGSFKLSSKTSPDPLRPQKSPKSRVNWRQVKGDSVASYYFSMLCFFHTYIYIYIILYKPPPYSLIECCNIKRTNERRTNLNWTVI